jgi:hypothetical protein
LKLPNGIFSGKLLPNELQGSHQRPDFLWPVRHTVIGEEWTVVSGDRIWCDCVGEGKPFDAPTGQGYDHALNQVIISAVACIYFQISLGKSQPQVLAFTLNKNLLRFFVVVGESRLQDEGQKKLWAIRYHHVKDRDLDLKSIGDCVRSKALARALRNRDEEKVREFERLRREMMGKEMEKWWVEKSGKRTQRSAEVNEKAAGGKKDPGPGSGGSGGGYSSGRGDDRDGGDLKKRRGGGSSYSEGSGGKSNEKGGAGFGKTHSLSVVIRKLARLTVSVVTLQNLRNSKIICSFPSEINFNEIKYVLSDTSEVLEAWDNI